MGGFTRNREVRAGHWQGLALGVAALLTVFGVAGHATSRAETSAAKAASAASRTTLTHPRPAAFTGRISSPIKRCKASRRVSLLFFSSRADRTGERVAGARSRRSGRWSVSHRPPSAGGIYRARLSGRLIRAGGRRVRCKKGGSPALAVPAAPGPAALHAERDEERRGDRDGHLHPGRDQLRRRLQREPQPGVPRHAGRQPDRRFRLHGLEWRRLQRQRDLSGDDEPGRLCNRDVRGEAVHPDSVEGRQWRGYRDLNSRRGDRLRGCVRE